MIKNGVNKVFLQANAIKRILITQPKPESDKSPYYDLSRKFNVALDFHPLITLEAISAKEFRKQKVEIQNYTAVIFTSRNAIEHFFRTCEELKLNVPQDTKYFCITEAVALFLQKFILYRKRKVFYGSDGTNKSMYEAINKHKNNEKFLYVCSENQQDNDICSWLKTNNCEFALGFLYRTQSNDIREILSANKYDIICFFTPSGIKSLFDNMPKYKQNGTVIGAFGSNTSKAAEEAGLKPGILAPQPKVPSMVSALELFLSSLKKGK